MNKIANSGEILTRHINLSPGPAKLPDEVVKRLKDEMFNYQNTGVAVFEISHRSKVFIDIYESTTNLLRKTLKVPDNYEILFIHGGASLQFTMLPVNFALPGKKNAYIDTGVWSKKAIKECKNLTDQVDVVASSEDVEYNKIPDFKKVIVNNEDHAYLHITTNNTIHGTQYKNYPKVDGVALIADASSDILTFEADFDKFDMLYGSHQKNMGISGIGFAIIKKTMLQRPLATRHSLLKYKTYADNGSMFNTPNTLGIYVTKIILEWVNQKGGVNVIAKESQKKAEIIYEALDNHPDLYLMHAEKTSRSNMNLVFFLPSKKLTQDFLAASQKKQILFTSGHRALGGVRLSVYIGIEVKQAFKIAQFLDDFAKSVK